MQRIGPFVLEKPLAKGGMGMVWSARHESTNIPVALKVVIPTAGVYLNDFLKLFRAEVRATAGLRHPNVVEVLDYGSLPQGVEGEGLVGGAPYYAMSFASSGSMETFVPKSWDELYTALKDVLRGLAHAHARHVVHRDIKPANILCDHTTGKLSFQLTDFGIAHAMDRETRTMGDDQTISSQEAASGTPHFMSPEQFIGSWRDFGPWTDLYAVGILAYALACGEQPFKSKTLRGLGMMHLSNPVPALKPKFPVPEALEEWIFCMTEKSIRDRTQTAADAIAQLDAMDDGLKQVGWIKAPVAASWKEFETGQGRVLSGAGLGLFGLRQFPLHGRDEACDTLWNNLLLAGAAGEVRVVLVHGPSGVGKSRLMNWFAATAAEAGAAQVFREGSRSAERMARGLVNLIAPFFRTRGMTSAEIENRVMEYLTAIGAVSMDMVRVLSGILDSNSETRAAVPASQAAEVVDRLLRYLAEDDRTVVAVMDDVQHNAAAIELVRQSLSHPGETENGVVYVLGVTDHAASKELQERLGEITAHPNTVSLRLDPLESQDIIGMIDAVVTLPKQAVKEVAKRSEGSPLLAVQLVNDWMERGILTAKDGVIAMRTDVPSMPVSMFKLWMDRIERLLFQVAAEGQIAENVRAQIELLATLGKETDIAEVEAVFADAGLPASDDLLDVMARRHLIRRVRDRVELEHGMLRDAILASAKERGTLEQRHAVCAKALSKLYPSRHPGLSLRLASHLIAAKSYMAGFIALEHASEHARRTYDVATLSHGTKLWLDAMQEAKVAEHNPMWAAAYSLRSYAFLLATESGSREIALDCADKAVKAATLSRDPDALLAASTRKALTTLYTGAWLDGADNLREAIAGYRGNSSNLQAEACITLGRLSAATRDLAEVLKCGRRALELATDEALKMQAHQVIARALLERGELPEAEAEIDLAINVCRSRGYFVAEGRSYQTKAFIMDASGDYAAAEASHRAALSLFELVASDSGYPSKEREFLGRALLAQGKFGAAMEEFSAVQASLEGVVSFRQNVSDGLLACAAAAEDWETFDRYIAPATRFEFAPSNLNFRALGIAFGRARDVDEERANRLLQAVMNLAPDEEDKREFFGAAAS